MNVHRLRVPLAGPIALVSAVALSVAGTATGSSTPASFETAAIATEPAVRTDPPRPDRPRVYLHYHGSEQLVRGDDRRWTYVRENLDGFFGKFSSAPDHDTALRWTAELTRKVRGRELVVEHPIASTADGSCVGFPDDSYYRSVEASAPDLGYERVAAALYSANEPECWGAGGGVDRALDVYRAQGYETVYALFQPQNLSPVESTRGFPRIAPGSSGDRAYRRAGGIALECPIDACVVSPPLRDAFFQAIRDAHARNVPFVWFTGYDPSYGLGKSGWLEKVQTVFDAVDAEGLWRRDDTIVLINYGGYPALPERRADGRPADTVTGILAWLLDQRVVSRR